jgi:hypothetical protein
MFKTIPADRSQLSSAELRQLAAEVRAAALATAQSEDEAERAEATPEALREQRVLARGLLSEADIAEDTEAEAAAVAAAAEETPDDPPVDPPAEPDDPPSEPDTEASAHPANVVPLATVPAVVHVGTELTGEPAAPARREPALRPDVIHRADSFSGNKADVPFASWGDFGMAAIKRARTVKPGSGEQVHIGTILGEYDDAHILSDNALDNLRKLDTLGLYDYNTRDEIMASVCPPATPYYGMACMNSTARPVAASLPGFAAPRGNVTIYPSPTLLNVAGSAGIWTQANDANVGATKNACARITCATSTTYGMYGVYWCFTVKNMELLTFPELVAAYLNRGAANFARLAEIQLLDAMGASLGEVKGPLQGPVSASTRVSTQLLQYMTLYREQQRWDDVPMHGWAPRWLLNALRIDLSRRNSRGTGFNFATEAEVNAVFENNVGINMTWYMDTPSWGEPLPFIVAGNPPSTGTTAFLNQLPSSADILVAPEGKFTMIDRAQVSLGVTGNNWYRDNASNNKNEVTFFVENYEGVVDTTSCPAHILHWDALCYNGREVADVVTDCNGLGT